MKSQISTKLIVKSNIITFLEKKKLTRTKCYQLTGICRGVLNQNNGLSEDNIRRFLNRFPLVNPTWLLTGIGPMEKTESSSVPKTQMNSIPLLPVQYFEDYFANGCLPATLSGVEWFDIPIFSNADFLFQMQGSGMSPVYYSGDFLICSALLDVKFIMWNSVFVLNTSIGVIVKRLRRGNTETSFKLVSEDTEYESMEMDLSDIYHLAVVIGFLRVC